MSAVNVGLQWRKMLWAQLAALGIKKTARLERLLEETSNLPGGQTSIRRHLVVQLPLWPNMVEPYVSGILVTAGPLQSAYTATGSPAPSTSDQPMTSPDGLKG